MQVALVGDLWRGAEIIERIALLASLPVNGSFRSSLCNRPAALEHRSIPPTPARKWIPSTSARRGPADWGAVTGLGVAIGPISGGLLLAHFAWPSVFLALVPVALLASVLAFVVVPESKNPGQARLDPLGLVLSSAAIAMLVYTIIEAPARGWTAPASLLGFIAAAALVVVFVFIERRREHPMLDVTLFRTPAFSAASGAVIVAFLALFGFIFLITQYFQFVRGYGTLSTGARILPVAITIAIGSVAGALLAARLGTRVVVVSGLLLFGSSFAWISVSSTFMPYTEIIGQMVLMGLGLGLTTAPATGSFLSVLPAAKAGVGSAVNDATREAGGTLGIAVIGSVFTSVYANHLTGGFTRLPAGAIHAEARPRDWRRPRRAEAAPSALSTTRRSRLAH